MKCRGNFEKIESIIHDMGFTITNSATSGNFVSYRIKRRDPAYRLVPRGGNWYFQEWVKEGKKVKATWFNRYYSNGGYDTVSVPNTTIMGNAAWFDLIIAILETGARVDVLGQKFEDVNSYHDYCDNMNLMELVEAEKEINS